MGVSRGELLDQCCHAGVNKGFELNVVDDWKSEIQDLGSGGADGGKVAVEKYGVQDS